MKKSGLLIYACLIALFTACEGVIDWQPGNDNVSPGAVSNIQVENIAGAARITYDLPNDEDLVAVEAVYEINGQAKRISASVYTNSLMVEGFGSTDPRAIQLYCVDRSRNYSQPVEVTINPLTPPVTSIFNSIDMAAGFGGVFLQWDNPTEAEVSIWILAEDETGEMKEKETIYTSVSSGQFNSRGMAPVEKKFGVYVRDRWNNFSDTLFMTLTPLFEEKLDAREFKRVALPRDENDNAQFALMFDGNIAQGMYTTVAVNASPMFFTIDLGRPVLLSRYKLWHRTANPYNNASPKLWKVYGSLSPNFSITDPNYWVNSYQDDWVLLSDVSDISQYKPSGDEFQNTPEDLAAAASGFELDFRGDAVPVRYLRFEVKENWALPTRVVIGELEFYGTYDN